LEELPDMTLIAKLKATFSGDSSKYLKKKTGAFHRQQFEAMRRFSQPLVTGWNR
jgi:hypothetical protein